MGNTYSPSKDSQMDAEPKQHDQVVDPLVEPEVDPLLDPLVDPLEDCENKHRCEFTAINFCNEKICEITQSSFHTIITTKDFFHKEYTLWAAGSNTCGQLGLGDYSNKDIYSEIKSVPKNISRVICGELFTLVLLQDGTLLSCGDNYFGTLALGDNLHRNVFHEIKSAPRNICEIYHGASHIIVKLTDGRLLGSGCNSSGQLGFGDRKNRTSFEEIKAVGKDIASVACGDHYTMIVRSDGTILSCGNNCFGQLGHCDRKDRCLFSEVKGIRVSSVHCGSYHTVIKLRSSKLMSCGDNRCGELGLGDYMPRSQFTEIALRFSPRATQIKCAWGYTLIKLSDGRSLSSGKYIKRSNIFIPTK